MRAPLPVAVAPGFSFGDLYQLGLAFFGLALFAGIGALSHQRERAFSASIIYLGLGGLAAATLGLLGRDPFSPVADAKLVEHVTELALVLAVFTTGLSLERPLRWREWRSVVALIAVVMPVTIAAVAAFGVAFMGLSLGAAVILGAVLAPTDPVLAGDVGVGAPGTERERNEPRFSLSGEAALNDGLASPFVLLGVFIAGQGAGGWVAEWVLADVLYAVAVGGAIGAAAGYGLAAVVLRLRDRGLILAQLDAWVAVPTGLLVYGLAEAAAAYGLVAAFVAGVAFRRYEFEHEYNRRVHDGAEVVEKLGELVVILLLGSMLTLAGLAEPGVAGWLLVPALLLVIRPAAVLGTFARNRSMAAGERVFLAWFGTRGVAALYYTAIVVETGVLSAEELATVVWTVLAAVAVSILAHGSSATALSERLLRPSTADAGTT